MRLPRQIINYGPDSLLLNWEQTITPEINAAVHAYAEVLRQHPAVLSCVPSYASLLVQYLPPKITAYQLKEFVYDLKPEQAEKSAPFLHELPVCYDPAVAPDLEATAALLEISPDQLVALHTAETYLVYQLGYRPGFGFLGQTAPELLVPRLSQPRSQVPAGAVGIAGRQTGVYPTASPGGWRLIGSCPVNMIRSGSNFSRLHPGDRVRFHSISLAAFSAFKDDTTWPKR